MISNEIRIFFLLLFSDGFSKGLNTLARRHHGIVVTTKNVVAAAAAVSMVCNNNNEAVYVNATRWCSVSGLLPVVAAGYTRYSAAAAAGRSVGSKTNGVRSAHTAVYWKRYDPPPRATPPPSLSLSLALFFARREIRTVFCGGGGYGNGR